MKDIREALEELVDKLEQIHADERYKGVWTHYMIHGMKYTGPNYASELEAAKTALSELRGMERGGEGLQDYWRCFHCDFATYNHAEAEAHFGDRDDAEEFKPLCKWWQLMDEDERIGTLQDTIMQLNEANSAEVAVCPKCHRPHYNMEDSAACRATPSVTEGVDGREK